MTTILDFPTLTRAPTASRWRLQAMTQSHRSPFNGAEQTLLMPGARWACTLDFASLSNADWRNLGQFLAQLQGRAGRFLFKPTWCVPRSTVSYGTPLVNGGSQTGSSLVTDGWANSTTVMQTGDFFSFADTSSPARTRLHMVTADVTSNGSGQATLAIAPPLRSSPADNAALTLSTPGAVFMLASDDEGEIAFDGARPDSAGGFRGAVSINIIEALV